MNQTITIKNIHGNEITLTGDIKGGLIVHKVGKYWTITHIATGLKIGQCSKLKSDIVPIRDALIALGCDWNQPTIKQIAHSMNVDSFLFADKIREIAY